MVREPLANLKKVRQDAHAFDRLVGDSVERAAALQTELKTDGIAVPIWLPSGVCRATHDRWSPANRRPLPGLLCGARRTATTPRWFDHPPAEKATDRGQDRDKQDVRRAATADSRAGEACAGRPSHPGKLQ